MSGARPSAGRTIDELKRSFLMDFHLPLQKWILLIIGVVGPLIYGGTAIDKGRWQDWALFGAMMAMLAMWALGLLYSRRGELERAVGLFVVAVVAFELTEMCLFHGTEGTAVLGMAAVTIYASMYNRRYLYVAGVGTIATILASEVVKYLEPWTLITNPPGERLAIQAAFAIVLGAVVIYILRKSQRIDETLFATLEENNAAQARIIETASKIQPVIDDVVRQIREVSSSFAAQAAEQASATAEVATTIRSVREGAAQSATAADETRDIAETTRKGSLETTRRIADVERGFTEALRRIEDSREVVTSLAERAEDIEEILEYNREIGEQIKILAINAAVQAAKAGEYGAGFRVVAAELRGMIQSTDSNLGRSRKLLDGIRARAKENAARIQEGSRLLGEYFDDLTATSRMIDTISASFVDTAERVRRIAQAARRQTASIDEVSAAVGQLDTAASQLESSGAVLLENVERIVASHEDLDRALGAPGA